MKQHQTICVLCQLNQANLFGFCQPCYNELPWLTNCCTLCALPMTTSDAVICGACLKNPPFFDKVLTPFLYQSPISKLIKAYKFQSRLYLASIFSALIQNAIQQHYSQRTWPEVIIPVPLHNSRLHERGYNQSILLATRLSKAHNIPLQRCAMKRTRATQAQHSINKSNRQSNMNKAFAVQAIIPARHVALIDDVVTTGATINAVSKTLRTAGIERIDVWSIARTP